jgi:transcription elongation factor Elf1
MELTRTQNEPLATVFPCLFCNHEKSVVVKLEKKNGVGQLNCKVCNQQYQCQVNCTPRFTFPISRLLMQAKEREGQRGCADKKTDLSAAVDVYADWVDACDHVAKENGQELGGGGDAPLRAPARAMNAGRARDQDEDDDGNLDELIDDEDDGGYGGDGIAVDDDY